MNMMSNHTMTRAEAVQHVARMFPRLDTNHDGFITRDEVDAIYRKMMSAMASGDAAAKLRERAKFMGDRGAMFHRLDTNHDGNISRQEFMTARPQVREQRMIVMREGGTLGAPGMGMRMHGMGGGMHFGGRLFDMADANKDGRVSLAEAQAAALAHFDKADLNHDGKITPDERQQMHRLRGERRQG